MVEAMLHFVFYNESDLVSCMSGGIGEGTWGQEMSWRHVAEVRLTSLVLTLEGSREKTWPVPAALAVRQVAQQAASPLRTWVSMSVKWGHSASLTLWS